MLVPTWKHGGFPKSGILGGPDNKDSSTFGSILRSPNIGRLPHEFVDSPIWGARSDPFYSSASGYVLHYRSFTCLQASSTGPQ